MIKTGLLCITQQMSQPQHKLQMTETHTCSCCGVAADTATEPLPTTVAGLPAAAAPPA